VCSSRDARLPEGTVWSRPAGPTAGSRTLLGFRRYPLVRRGRGKACTSAGSVSALPLRGGSPLAWCLRLPRRSRAPTRASRWSAASSTPVPRVRTSTPTSTGRAARAPSPRSSRRLGVHGSQRRLPPRTGSSLPHSSARLQGGRPLDPTPRRRPARRPGARRRLRILVRRASGRHARDYDAERRPRRRRVARGALVTDPGGCPGRHSDGPGSATRSPTSTPSRPRSRT
jgi:hypothetical protein